MLRYGAAPIIILVNNQGYSIEVEIHDGPYNKIHVWCARFFACASRVTTRRRRRAVRACATRA